MSGRWDGNEFELAAEAEAAMSREWKRGPRRKADHWNEKNTKREQMRTFTVAVPVPLFHRIEQHSREIGETRSMAMRMIIEAFFMEEEQD